MNDVTGVCLYVTSVVACEAQQLVSGMLTTPYDVTFGDVIDGECPDDDSAVMNNGLSFDRVKCTVYRRTGLMNAPQSHCHISK